MERILADDEIMKEGDLWLESNGDKSKITNIKYYGALVSSITNRWPDTKVLRVSDPFDELLEKLEQIRKELWTDY